MMGYKIIPPVAGTYSPPAGQVVIDGSVLATTVTGAVSTSDSASFTMSANSNKAIGIIAINGSSLNVTGVSFLSGSATGSWAQAPSGSTSVGGRFYEIWGVVGVAAGSTQLRLTWSGNIGADDGTFAIFPLYGVDQTMMFSTCVPVGSGPTTVSGVLTAGGLFICGLSATGDPGIISVGVEDYDNSGNDQRNIAHNLSAATITWPNANGRGILAANIRAQ